MRHDKSGWYADLTPEQLAAEREAAKRRHRRRRALPPATEPEPGSPAAEIWRSTWEGVAARWRDQGLL